MTEDDLNRMLEEIIIEEFDRTTVACLRYRHNVTTPVLIGMDDAVIFAGRGRNVKSINAIRDDCRN